MYGEPWLHAALLALGLLHVLGVASWHAARGEARADGEDGDAAVTAAGGDSGTAAGAERVTCPQCGASNEQGYRFCRRCVGEIPGSDDRAGGTVPARRGSTF